MAREELTELSGGNRFLPDHDPSARDASARFRGIVGRTMRLHQQREHHNLSPQLEEIESDDKCSICREHNVNRKLPCDHELCVSCTTTIRNLDARCPFCRHLFSHHGMTQIQWQDHVFSNLDERLPPNDDDNDDDDDNDNDNDNDDENINRLLNSYIT